MSGWVKLYCKSIHNPIWQMDRTAWQIFEYLLLRAYESTPQNRVVTTRQRIAEACHSNNSTVYKALARLKNAEMVTTKSTNKYTIISIRNWHKYQDRVNNAGNNKVTTKEQQSNTLNKSIDNRDKNKSKDLVASDKRNPELQELIDYATSKGFSLQGSQRVNRQYAYNLLRKKYRGEPLGLDRCKWLVDVSLSLAGKPYKPQIIDFKSLFYKWQGLIVHVGKEKYGRYQTSFGGKRES